MNQSAAALVLFLLFGTAVSFAQKHLLHHRLEHLSMSTGDNCITRNVVREPVPSCSSMMEL